MKVSIGVLYEAQNCPMIWSCRCKFFGLEVEDITEVVCDVHVQYTR